MANAYVLPVSARHQRWGVGGFAMEPNGTGLMESRGLCENSPLAPLG